MTGIIVVTGTVDCPHPNRREIRINKVDAAKLSSFPLCPRTPGCKGTRIDLTYHEDVYVTRLHRFEDHAFIDNSDKSDNPRKHNGYKLLDFLNSHGLNTRGTRIKIEVRGCIFRIV